MNLPYGEPITIVSRVKSGVDDYGNSIYSEVSITRQGGFNRSLGFESVNGQNQIQTQPQVFFTGQAAVDVAAHVDTNSAVIRKGKRYEVDGGDLDLETNPMTGRVGGIVIPLKLVTG